jgi:hypothetical protein
VGDNRKALDYFVQALEIRRALRQPIEEAIMLDTQEASLVGSPLRLLA